MTIAMIRLSGAGGGSDWLLPSFAAPAIGGTLISGRHRLRLRHRHGRVAHRHHHQRTAVLNVSNFWLNLFLGLVLLIAVVLAVSGCSERARR